jgi:hypothetical protein
LAPRANISQAASATVRTWKPVVIGQVTSAPFCLANALRMARTSEARPAGMARMKASIWCGVGTSIISPARIPAIEIGAGLTVARAGALSFSVQLFIAVFPSCAPHASS